MNQIHINNIYTIRFHSVFWFVLLKNSFNLFHSMTLIN